MRILRNIRTGRRILQWPHLITGQYRYLPVNDQWHIED